MLRQSLEQRMQPEMRIVNEFELTKIAQELDTHIFNKSQEEKLHRKYQDYLYHAEQALKKASITEEHYLTTVCFYLFPVEQLGLSFKEEKQRFFDVMRKEYDHRPEIKIGLSEDEEWFSAGVDKRRLKEEGLIISTKDRIKDKIDARINESLHRLERGGLEDKRTSIADAYGITFITPIYFGHKAERRAKERYDDCVKGVEISVSKPYDI